MSSCDFFPNITVVVSYVCGTSVSFTIILVYPRAIDSIPDSPRVHVEDKTQKPCFVIAAFQTIISINYDVINIISSFDKTLESHNYQLCAAVHQQIVDLFIDPSGINNNKKKNPFYYY